MARRLVHIGPHNHDRLIAIARSALPNEACGFLVGSVVAESQWRVDSVLPITNSSEEPARRFVLDPAEMIAAERRIDDEDAQVIGVFHSHPSSRAEPSATDCADAAQYDPTGAWLHVITSMQAFVPHVRAWRYVGAHPADAQPVLIDRTDHLA